MKKRVMKIRRKYEVYKSESKKSREKPAAKAININVSNSEIMVRKIKAVLIIFFLLFSSSLSKYDMKIALPRPIKAMILSIPRVTVNISSTP